MYYYWKYEVKVRNSLRKESKGFYRIGLIFVVWKRCPRRRFSSTPRLSKRNIQDWLPRDLSNLPVTITTVQLSTTELPSWTLAKLRVPGRRVRPFCSFLEKFILSKCFIVAMGNESSIILVFLNIIMVLTIVIPLCAVFFSLCFLFVFEIWFILCLFQNVPNNSLMKDATIDAFAQKVTFSHPFSN